MKKKILLFTMLFAFILNVSAQESIISDVFEKFVEDKISSMQEVIDINDEQARQLKEVELNFLLDVNSAENCWWCKSKKKISKLKKNRSDNLQQVLTREQYIKYDVVENDRIINDPPLLLR